MMRKAVATCLTCPALERQLGRGSSRGISILSGNQYAKDDDKCKKLEDTGKKDGMICRRPNLMRKKIPPYRYGYCREADVPMLMSCPPKAKARGKGPCCHDDVQQKKGGCRVQK